MLIGLPNIQVLKNKPDFRRKPWPTISNGAKDFVKKLLVKDPRARLTAAQALCEYPVLLLENINDDYYSLLEIGTRVLTKYFLCWLLKFLSRLLSFKVLSLWLLYVIYVGLLWLPLCFLPSVFDLAS